MKRKLVASLMLALMVATSMPQVVWAQTTEVTAQKVNNTYQNTKVKAEELGKITVETYGTPSMQYALMVDGEVVVSGVHSVDGMTEETLYGIGSVSKMYTATAMMKLVEMGKVDLDAAVTTYIPEFKMADERYKDITVRMLLNHSSGLMGSTLEDAFLFEDNDTYAYDHLLEALKGQRLKADPGAFSVYCNDGFTLAELVIERVSDMTFTEFITTYIVEPLGLTSTRTPENQSNWSELANSYSSVYAGVLPKEAANVIGTGGVYATAQDLAKFGGIFTGETSILSDQSLEAMQTNEAAKGIWPEETDNIVDYGLGWDSVRLYPFNEYDIQALVKGGDTLNYHASLIVLPEQNMSVAVVSSGGSSTINQMVGTQILLSALVEKGEITSINPDKTFTAPTAAQLPQEMKKYEGLYVSMGQMMSASMDENGLLSLSVVGAEYLPAQTFQYTSEGVFMSADGSAKVSFVEESNGETYLYVEGYAVLPGLGEMASAYYNAQKVESSTLTESEKAAWEKRNGKMYYVINEKYTSASYQISIPAAGILMSENSPGYMAGYEITGPDTAQAVGQIPGLAGRDQMDITFYTKDGVEYLQLGSNLAISQDAVPNLYKGDSKCTIGSEGYGRWFEVGPELANKTMTVTVPSTGAFAVYDANGVCVNYTTVSKNPTVTLAEGSKVIFMGDAGSVFDIKMK